MARELGQLQANVIFALGDTVRAAGDATTTSPIVMILGGDPVTRGEGARSADLPLEQRSKFELVTSLKTALVPTIPPASAAPRRSGDRMTTITRETVGQADSTFRLPLRRGA